LTALMIFPAASFESPRSAGIGDRFLGSTPSLSALRRAS
jgi:hypothetical protein